MKAARNGIRAVIIRPGEDPEEYMLLPDDNGYVNAMEQAVEGFLLPFPALFGDKPCLYVNGGEDKPACPNRAVYANERMHRERYSSPADPTRVVEAGELFEVLCGNILAVSFDVAGDLRSMTDTEVQRVCDVFSGKASQESGRKEAEKAEEGKEVRHDFA